MKSLISCLHSQYTSQTNLIVKRQNIALTSSNIASAQKDHVSNPSFSNCSQEKGELSYIYMKEPRPLHTFAFYLSLIWLYIIHHKESQAQIPVPYKTFMPVHWTLRSTLSKAKAAFPKGWYSRAVHHFHRTFCDGNCHAYSPCWLSMTTFYITRFCPPHTLGMKSRCLS